MKNDYGKLKLYLIVSLSLNAGLLTGLVVSIYQSQSPYKKQMVRTVPLTASLHQEVQRLNHLSLAELQKLLQDGQLIEEGYRRCDLAASLLLSVHRVDIARALGYVPGGQMFDLGAKNILLFSDLTSEQLKAIGYFLKVEKWPYEASYLLEKIRQEWPAPTKSLVEAFTLASPYREIKNLLKRSYYAINDSQILPFFFELPLEKLEEVARISEGEPMQAFFWNLYERGSKRALFFLLELDSAYLLKKASNESLELIIDAIIYPEESAARFLDRIHQSLRPFSIKEKARRKKEGLWPGKCEIEEKAPLLPLKKTSPAVVSKKREYRICPGDTLWKIAKEYGITIEQLREANQLEPGQKIRPGKIIEIPEKKRS